jgi:hypothetical protein
MSSHRVIDAGHIKSINRFWISLQLGDDTRISPGDKLIANMLNKFIVIKSVAISRNLDAIDISIEEPDIDISEFVGQSVEIMRKIAIEGGSRAIP